VRLALLVTFVLFVAAAFVAFGWLVDQNTAHAVGLVALGLAVELLAGVDVPAIGR
jgi:hypothetical protein